MTRYIVRGILGLLAILAIILLIGWSLPVDHQASRSALIAAPPPAVFALIETVEAYPVWRRGVTKVDVLQRDPIGRPVLFREHGPDGVITFEIEERDAPHRLVNRIADPDLPFGGQWTFEIAPAPGGSTLTITEDGKVHNPLFRFVSRFVMGHTRGIERYLEDLTSRLVEPGRAGQVARAAPS